MSNKCTHHHLVLLEGLFSSTEEYGGQKWTKLLLYKLFCTVPVTPNYLKIGKLSTCGSMLQRYNQTCVPFLYPSWNNCWKLLPPFVVMHSNFRLFWCARPVNWTIWVQKKKKAPAGFWPFIQSQGLAWARSPTQPSYLIGIWMLKRVN